MSFIHGDTRGSLRARQRLLKSAGIDYNALVCAGQAHGSQVIYVTEEDKGRGALSYNDAITAADALITDRQDVPLAIFTADCLSIFLYDPLRPAIGLVHAGWRGSRENIADMTVRLMRERFNTRAKDLYAAFGPVIRECCYEVGQEFRGFFPHDFLRERKSRYYLDLAGMNKKQLLDLGIPGNNIFDPAICTSCQNDEFFSYRKEGGECGRIISLIMLKKEALNQG